MARARRTPDELLAALGELDADERTELAEALAAQQTAEADLADADTPAEADAAAADLEAAERELAEAFEAAGLSAEQGRALMLVVDRASSANTEAAVRRVLEEYALEPADDAGGGGGPDDGGTDPGGDPAGAAGGTGRRGRTATALADLQDDPEATPAPPPPAEVPPEETPATQHWFHRPIVKKESDA